MQDDLVQVRDDALKLWLREQAALARITGAGEAFWRAWAAGFITRIPRGSHGPTTPLSSDGVQRRRSNLFGLEFVKVIS